MANMYEAAALSGMKRSELQKLAKKHGIKANMKTDELIKALAAVTDSDAAEEPTSTPTTQREEVITASSTDQSETEMSEKKPKGRRGRGRKQKNVKETVEDTSTASETESPTKEATAVIATRPETESDVQASSTMEDEKSPASRKAKATAKGRGRGRGRRGKKTEEEPVEAQAVPTPPAEVLPVLVAVEAVASPAVSVRRSRSKQATPITNQPIVPTPPLPTPPHSGSSRYTRKATRPSTHTPIPPVQPTPPAANKKRSSRSASKITPAVTPATKTPETATEPETRGKRSASGSTGNKAKRVRRGTFDKSPAKETSVEETKSSGSTLKDDIMAEIDRKVQLARAKSGIPTRVQPSKKNWSKTHKAYEKMESIDDYLERKRKRAEALSSSKKPRVKPAVAKSVTKLPALSFASPKPNCKPIASNPKSAKTVSFKVSKLKTPAKPTLPSVAAAAGVGKRRATPGARKSVSIFTPGSTVRKSAGSSVRKSVGSAARKSVGGVTPGRERKSLGAAKTPSRKSVGGAVTPFRQTTASPAKNPFDLKASLSKPLTYKPHIGKLKPFGETQFSEANVKQSSNIVHAKTLIKKPHLKGRDNRRAGNLKHRTQKRNDSFMARRGIPGC